MVKGGFHIFPCPDQAETGKKLDNQPINTIRRWRNSDTEIEEVAVDCFEDLFTSTSPTKFEEALAEISPLITGQLNESLTATTTEDEVRKVLCLMNLEKAPGADGMTTLFFQRSWNIVKTDILNLVNGFLGSGSFDQRLNVTNICLIPKTERPT